jgi:NADH-quinone oxidoreductase subunit L
MLNLSGMPFFSGGWTKEDILHATAAWPLSRLPYYLMLAGVVLTALYMTRQMIFVFFGNRRAASQKAHESPSVMTLPLIMLAVCSIALALVLTPAWPWLHEYLVGERAHLDLSLLIQPALYLSLALVVGGIALGLLIYGKAGQTDPVEQTAPALFRFLANKMWIDELYERTIIALAQRLARASDWMDRNVWDGFVRGLAQLAQFFGIFTAGFDERGINAGVDQASTGARGVGLSISHWHSGRVPRYLSAVAVGMLALLLLYAWLS